MWSKRNILICLIFKFVQDSNTVTAEWVELPQFSDEAKVYRVPFTKDYRGEKYFLKNQDGSAIHSFSNASAVDEGFQKIKIHQQSAIDRSPRPSLSSGNSPPISLTTETVYKFENTQVTITQSPQKIKNFSQENFFGDEAVTVEVQDEEVTVPTTSFSDEIVVHKDQPYQSVPSTDRPQKADEPEEEDDSKASFLAYMPLELFKKVHATLKSQPSTIKGKLSFLKRFEITLLAEIEKRLVPVFSPVRIKRDSRGDHDWDSHEDSHVGFPSLEGALMAISFLTFAVYLIQLIMMLFRNLGNPVNPLPPATLLFNRNIRSVEEFTEDTARVLDYLDKFAKSQSIENSTIIF